MSFYSEIQEQPIVAARLAQAMESEAYQAQIQKLQDIITQRKPSQYIFAGMGSSLFASYIATSLLRRHGIRAYAMEARELLAFDAPIIDEDTFLFAVSQSGNSQETFQLCEKYRDFPALATITNLPTSRLYPYGQAHFTLEAGPEKHTATKSYSNTVLTIVYLAHAIAGNDLKPIMQDILNIVPTMESLVSASAQELTVFWEGSTYTALVGSGVSNCTACHAGLVLMEAAHVNAASYTVAQFAHGPIEIINEQFCTILFDFEPAVREDLDRVMASTLKYGGRVILFTQRTDVAPCDRLMINVIPCGNSELAPALEILPIELMTLEIGRRKGLCPGDLYRVHK